MEKQITELMARAKAQVDERWPEGEEAPVFEELRAQFKDLLVYVAGEYYGFSPSDKHAVQCAINDMMRID